MVKILPSPILFRNASDIVYELQLSTANDPEMTPVSVGQGVEMRMAICSINALYNMTADPNQENKK
jgi:hypothetical protein